MLLSKVLLKLRSKLILNKIIDLHVKYLADTILAIMISLHKKQSFPLTISLVNVTESAAVYDRSECRKIKQYNPP